jgi:formyl-CoA transferase
MTRVTGFGQTGPYKDRPGFGTLAEAMSGFAHITGQPDGPPTLPPLGLADSITALYSVFGIMYALYWRDTQDGSGQYIDMSILEPAFATTMQGQVVEYSEKGIIRERMGNRVPYTAPRNTYKTKDDKWVVLAASAESIAKRVLRIVGGEDLVNDPRFQSMQKRVENVEALDELIQDWFFDHTREEAIEIFHENEAAIAPVNNIQDIFEDEHINARNALIDVEDDELGEITMHGVFPKLSKTPGEVRHPGPRLGKHTREVLLSETPLTDPDIDHLSEDGVIHIDE